MSAVTSEYPSQQRYNSSRPNSNAQSDYGTIRYINVGLKDDIWMRGTAVERLFFFAGELSLSCARPVDNR